jgi:16S rRNA U516 pseudouridylate synthase RsuA-like enzyme
MKKPRATLDRVLSKAGIASRTTTREWIQQGRVKVNGGWFAIRNIGSRRDVVCTSMDERIRDEKKSTLPSTNRQAS